MVVKMLYYRLLPASANNATPGSETAAHIDHSTNLIINIMSREQLNTINFNEHPNELFMYPEIGEPMYVVDAMPAATQLLLDKYILYIGAAIDIYEQYGVYKCYYDSVGETHKWEPVKFSSQNLDSVFLSGTTAPTASTVGVVGQQYLNTITKTNYICTVITVDGADKTYTWEKTASEIMHGVCSSAADTVAKTASITNFTLVEGMLVMVTFLNGNSVEDATLNISDSGAKLMTCDGVALTTGALNMLSSNMTAIFRYDGTSLVLLNPSVKLHSHDSVYAPQIHGHDAEDITGLGGAAIADIGTTAGTVSAGDHDHSGVYSPVSHSHSAYVPLAGATMEGVLVAKNNTSYTTKQMRNIFLSTSSPSGGGNGDIWFKYS